MRGPRCRCRARRQQPMPAQPGCDADDHKDHFPVDGSVYAERTAATAAQIDQTLQRARAAQPKWREVPIAERAAIIERFCGEFERRGAAIATGLSWQMGRPIRFAPSEVRGTLERARYMTGIAP